jgi:hypothetical protein
MVQWKRLELLFPNEFFTFDASLDCCTDISEYSRPEVPSPENFVDCGSPKMMSPTQAIMKVEHNILGLLWV